MSRISSSNDSRRIIEEQQRAEARHRAAKASRRQIQQSPGQLIVAPASLKARAFADGFEREAGALGQARQKTLGGVAPAGITRDRDEQYRAAVAKAGIQLDIDGRQHLTWDALKASAGATYADAAAAQGLTMTESQRVSLQYSEWVDGKLGGVNADGDLAARAGTPWDGFAKGVTSPVTDGTFIGPGGMPLRAPPPGQSGRFDMDNGYQVFAQTNADGTVSTQVKVPDGMGIRAPLAKDTADVLKAFEEGHQLRHERGEPTDPFNGMGSHEKTRFDAFDSLQNGAPFTLRKQGEGYNVDWVRGADGKKPENRGYTALAHDGKIAVPGLGLIEAPTGFKRIGLNEHWNLTITPSGAGGADRFASASADPLPGTYDVRAEYQKSPVTSHPLYLAIRTVATFAFPAMGVGFAAVDMAQAAKAGNTLGMVAAGASAVASGLAAGGLTTAAVAAQGVSAGIRMGQAIDNGDALGAAAAGVSVAGAAAGVAGFNQVADAANMVATGIGVGKGIADGDFTGAALSLGGAALGMSGLRNKMLGGGSGFDLEGSALGMGGAQGGVSGDGFDFEGPALAGPRGVGGHVDEPFDLESPALAGPRGVGGHVPDERSAPIPHSRLDRREWGPLSEGEERYLSDVEDGVHGMDMARQLRSTKEGIRGLTSESRNAILALAARAETEWDNRYLARVVNSPGFQDMPSDDRSQLITAMSAGGAESIKGFYDLMGKPELLNARDANGITALSNIYRLATDQLDDRFYPHGADPETVAFFPAGTRPAQRAELIRDLVSQLASPHWQSQGAFGTCAAATLTDAYAARHPGDLVRMVTDLATQGKTTLPDGHTMLLPHWAEQSSAFTDRGTARALFDSSLMNYAQPGGTVFDVYNTVARNLETGLTDGVGLRPEKQIRLLDSLFGGSHDVMDSWDDPRPAIDFLQQLPHDFDQPVPMTIWTGEDSRTGLHSVTFQKIEGDRIFFSDPRGLLGPTDLSNANLTEQRVPGLRTAGSLYSMSLADFALRLRNIIVPSDR